MANVTIWRDENALFKSAKLPFPFTMEQFIDAIDKIDCPRELNAIERIAYEIDNINEYSHANIVSMYTGENNNQPLIYVNMLALLSDNIDTYEFGKAVFYVREVGVHDMLEFANVLCEIESSNIYPYGCSESYEGADVRLGKEIVFLVQEERIPDWLMSYVNFAEIGYDENSDYYYDDDFYVYANDIGIDEEYYDDWEELTSYELDEWNFAEFKELLLEKENKHELDMSFTDEILGFLEKGA